ncbi:hypothetical protein AERO9AM_20442 [Aeromicrobium sp. 9AM]|nr:hypothetical protein AERO9AM_20442 [Aeromicrobium sp. 9AM]
MMLSWSTIRKNLMADLDPAPARRTARREHRRDTTRLQRSGPIIMASDVLAPPATTARSQPSRHRTPPTWLTGEAIRVDDDTLASPGRLRRSAMRFTNAPRTFV